MRHTIIIILIFIIGGSCKKSNFNDPRPAAALNVINAAPDVPSLNINYTSDPVSYANYLQPISYGSAFEWTLVPGDSPVVIVSSADTSGYIYTGNLNLTGDHIYSLYVLNGSGKDNILLLKDTLPFYQDSVAAVRFINLSPDSHPLTINLAGSPENIVSGPLAYKEISAFKTFNTNGAANGSYDFEVRDQATGDLLNTYSWTFSVFKNQTIVISGSVDPASSTPLMLFTVNNF